MSSRASAYRASLDRDFEVKQLVDNGKVFARWGEHTKALQYFKKAQKIRHSDKLDSQIQKLQDIIAEESDQSEVGDDYLPESDAKTEIKDGFMMRTSLLKKMYAHQLEGILWMYGLWGEGKKGGILADDMGLGKTMQIISYVSSMMDMKKIRNVLLIIPMSLIRNWQREFNTWAPHVHVECFHGGNSNRRISVLHRAFSQRSVVITTYGLVLIEHTVLSRNPDGKKFIWDYTILDEGHKIKNPMKTTRHMHSIPSKNRIILTGTPVQNSLRDLWALMDWTLQGSLLGTQRTFRYNYELPIERARQRDATPTEIQLGNKMAESLRKITDEYIMRRTKALLCTNQYKSRISGMLSNKLPVFPKLPRKNDLVVWVFLSELQQKLYRDFIELEEIRWILSINQNPLVYLTVMKKLCDHPRLLSKKACQWLRLPQSSIDIDVVTTKNSRRISEEVRSGAKAGGSRPSTPPPKRYSDTATTIRRKLRSSQRLDANGLPMLSRAEFEMHRILLSESGKLQFLLGLVTCLQAEGHRTLVFSTSRKMLDIIHTIFLNLGFKVMRMDGLVSSLNERERRVTAFQEDESWTVFLLTTQVGGVGLNLTGADRVVIFDPSWNPATDNQAVDRVYRIGQNKNIVVYRLITCGTLEEKIYRRQIFKTSVINQTTEQTKDPFRYFASGDLYNLFELDDPTHSSTQVGLEKLHGHQRNWPAELKIHLQNLKGLPFFGVSEHDLMFSKKADDFNYEQEMAKDNFNEMVAEAMQEMQRESRVRSSTAIRFKEGRFDDVSYEPPSKFVTAFPEMYEQNYDHEQYMKRMEEEEDRRLEMMQQQAAESEDPPSWQYWRTSEAATEGPRPSTVRFPSLFSPPPPKTSTSGAAKTSSTSRPSTTSPVTAATSPAPPHSPRPPSADKSSDSGEFSSAPSDKLPSVAPRTKN